MIYTFLSLIPLGIAYLGTLPLYRTFWIELGVAFGFIGLGMLGLQFLFSGRFSWIAPTYGMDNIIQYHREVGIVAFLFVLAHPVTLILSDPQFLSYFDIQVNAPRAIALSFVSIALLGIMATSLWRKVFKLNYELWRLFHGLLGVAIIFIGAIHSIQVSHYLDPAGKKVALVGLMGFYLYLIIHTRLVRPWLNRKFPHKIIKVQKERGDAFSLTIEPVGFRRMEFSAGQFAWITIHPSPFSLQQHPFSIVSTEKDKTMTFTAKIMGDFTSEWENLKPGAKVFVEGPYGSFVSAMDHPIFLIMGGIGITPGMSMLRTWRDSHDQRRTILLYANLNWEEITFRDELEEMENEMNLKVIHLLEEPPEGWVGETGLIEEKILAKYLPHDKENFMYFICGPKPLMDISEISLRNLGIEWKKIYTERFEIV
ncbi:MAG: ferric reductase-like transmembrane domain-containing protein [Anditalea sp.]